MRKLATVTSTLGAAAVFSALTLWAIKVNGPPPDAENLARANVDGCYSGGATGDGTDCGGIFRDVRDAAEMYGPLQTYRIESVKRSGILSTNFEVLVTTQRRNHNLRETVTVQTGRSHAQERDYANMLSMVVRPQ